jgi:hypothetical protein
MCPLYWRCAGGPRARPSKAREFRPLSRAGAGDRTWSIWPFSRPESVSTFFTASDITRIQSAESARARGRGARRAAISTFVLISYPTNGCGPAPGEMVDLKRSRQRSSNLARVSVSERSLPPCARPNSPLSRRRHSRPRFHPRRYGAAADYASAPARAPSETRRRCRRHLEVFDLDALLVRRRQHALGALDLAGAAAPSARAQRGRGLTGAPYAAGEARRAREQAPGRRADTSRRSFWSAFLSLVASTPVFFLNTPSM